jgi:hypothetical protein
MLLNRFRYRNQPSVLAVQILSFLFQNLKNSYQRSVCFKIAQYESSANRTVVRTQSSFKSSAHIRETRNSLDLSFTSSARPYVRVSKIDQTPKGTCKYRGYARTAQDLLSLLGQRE